MLDFLKLGLLVSQIGLDSVVETKDNTSTLKEALEVFGAQARDHQNFAARLTANAPWILWPTAQPLEGLYTAKNILPLQSTVAPWTVLGVDGSQIMPSHHEVHNCYLLNCGLIRISYGLDLPPLLTSEPRLYARPEDLYPLVDRRRIYIDELYVSLERSIFELEQLTEKSLAAAAQIVHLGGKDKSRVLAMYDGSLIPWSAEKMSDEYLESYLGRFESCLNQLQQAGVAVVGYVSKSRAADLVNDLRSAICPYQVSLCREQCCHLNEEEFPCSRVWPLTDRTLYDSILEMHQRSCVMVSGASVVKSMAAENAICFTYVKAESEVARLEFPRWLFEDQDLFDFAVSGVLSQILKGQGYPVALSEAHYLAVIKGPEREKFFDLMGEKLMQLGVTQVRPSPKEIRKRTGFV